MKWFGGGKKKDEEQKVPESADFPMRAYVYRLTPEKVGRVQVAGRVPGDFDGFQTTQDLEDMVAKLCGGGTFRCKVCKSKDPKFHVGYHSFTIPGAPLLDGEPIDPNKGREDDSGAPGGGRKLNKIEEEAELEEAQTRLDEIKAKRMKRRQELGLDEMPEDDDAGTPPVMPMPGTDPVILQLQQQVKTLEMMQQKKDRELDEERHRREISDLKAEFSRQIESLKHSNNDGGAVVAQIEAMKTLMNAGQEQMKAMLQSNTELTKVMLTRDNQGGMTDRFEKMVDKLVETKANAGKDLMDAMKESFQTGILMAKGGEQAPATMADVAREFSGRVLDVVSDYMHQRGQVSKEALAQEIQNATQRVVAQVTQRFAPAIARLAPRGGTPADSAMPSAGPEQPALPAVAQGQPLTDAERNRRVDLVLHAFIHDIEHKTETWKGVVAQNIPQEELQRIGSLDFEHIAAYAQKYGTPALVQEVGLKLASLGANTPEERAAVDAARAGQAQADPNVRASATAEDAQGVIDGAGADEEEDEEEEEPEPEPPQQAPAEVVPQAGRRGRRR